MTNPRIDTYIGKSEDFAKPILLHLRKLIHEACPEAEEVIKWGFPNFDYHSRPLCSMASFKKHCAFGFWLGGMMDDPDKILNPVGEKSAMGSLGKITSLKDLPKDSVLKRYIAQAMKLNELGVTIPKKVSALITEKEIPNYFKKALDKNPAAKAVFKNFSNSHKKEYIEWLEEAKTEATRLRRMETAIEWISESKGRNWKYMKK